MNENTLSASIANLRKTSGLTQDALASKLGVTYQAVSKWENGASCPDVMLLPEIANIFNVSIDELFGREAPIFEAPALPAPEPSSDTPCDTPWDDDDTLRIVLFHGKELLQAIPEETATKLREIPFVYNGPALNISSVLNVYCNNCDIGGDVSASGNVFCGEVGGDVNANGSVECADVGGGVDAQGSIHCSDIGGDAKAGGNIECSDVGGNARAGGNIDCSDVGGNASAGNELDCGEVGGNATAGGNLSCGEVGGSASAGCDVSADEVCGNVIASRDVRCGDISGDVRAGGSVKCGDVCGDIYGTTVTPDSQTENDFTIEFDSFDSKEFDNNVSEFARKAEEMAKNAVNMTKNYLDQLNFSITNSPKGKQKSADTASQTIVTVDDDYEISDIINSEIDSAIEESIDSGDYDSISRRINEKMSKISEKINQHFNDRYGK